MLKVRDEAMIKRSKAKKCELSMRICWHFDYTQAERQAGDRFQNTQQAQSNPVKGNNLH